jgi:serine/threonine-protein kinase
MLKRTGNAKLIDIGGAFARDDAPARPICTPAYAAPEILEGSVGSPQSDLASLGYVLVEMLSGVPTSTGPTPLGALREAQQSLGRRLPEILPADIRRDELLLSLIRGLIAPDPEDRFPDAETADLVDQGAANFQRRLVKNDLASEYDNEIRAWLEVVD